MYGRKQVLHCLWKSLLMILLFCQAASGKTSEDRSFRELDSMMEAKIVFGFNTALRYCGEYLSSFPVENNTITISYTFFGKTADIPHSFLLKHYPEKSITDIPPENVKNPDIHLNYEEECSIKEYDNELVYLVESNSIYFSSPEELEYFECDNSTIIGKRIPLREVNCTHDSLVRLKNRLNSTEEVHCMFHENYIQINHFNNSMAFNMNSSNGCEDSIAAIFGVILTISLVIAFLFFMLYNYSKQTKTKYIGNGINVNHIKHISKPIPSGVNPYSTKVEHIVDLPKEEPTITTIEIPTISVIHHGTRSSFMMLSSL